MMTAPISARMDGSNALRPGMLVARRKIMKTNGSSSHGRTASATHVAVSPNGAAHNTVTATVTPWRLANLRKTDERLPASSAASKL